jgi:hypothetical protein
LKEVDPGLVAEDKNVETGDVALTSQQKSRYLSFENVFDEVPHS